jgi:hypothetical protein
MSSRACRPFQPPKMYIVLLCIIAEWAARRSGVLLFAISRQIKSHITFYNKGII